MIVLPFISPAVHSAIQNMKFLSKKQPIPWGSWSFVCPWYLPFLKSIMGNIFFIIISYSLVSNHIEKWWERSLFANVILPFCQVLNFHLIQEGCEWPAKHFYQLVFAYVACPALWARFMDEERVVNRHLLFAGVGKLDCRLKWLGWDHCRLIDDYLRWLLLYVLNRRFHDLYWYFVERLIRYRGFDWPVVAFFSWLHLCLSKRDFLCLLFFLCHSMSRNYRNI